MSERTEKLKAVHVCATDNGDEYYAVGSGGVTEIKWSTIHGHMALLDSVQVFIEGKLHSEHPFANCLSVYFDRESQP